MKYKWEISSSSSFIEFSLKYFEIGRIKGHFKKITSEIYAGKGFEDPDINIWLAANSVDTLTKEWNDRMVTKSFLWADEFPVISFKASDGCRLSIGGIQELKGELKIRDRTNEINLLVTLSNVKKFKKELNAHFCLTTSFLLSDYGFDVGNSSIGNLAVININLILVTDILS